MRRATISAALLGLSVLAGACDTDLTSKAQRPAPPEPALADASETPTGDDEAPGFIDDPAELDVDPAIAAKAKALWDTRCARCHGPYGDGDGAAGKGLEPPPRNFHEGKWQAEAADAHIKKVILGGGAAAGLSPSMGANVDLRDKPELVEQLVVILRGLPHWRPAPSGSLEPAIDPAAPAQAPRPAAPAP
ncbi:MAG: c-type cytochrome [Nannocystaceae bacterium]